MRRPLLLSGAAHGLLGLLLVAGTALWPAAQPAIPPVLAEVELIVQKTPSVGPKAAANARPHAPSRVTPEPPAPPERTATAEAAAKPARAPLPLPPRRAPQPPPPRAVARAITDPSREPAPPQPRLSPEAARGPTQRALGTGLVSGPGIVPAAIDAAVRNVPPGYPPSAVRRGEQGTVLLEVVVAPDGAARTVSVAASSGYPILDRAAREAVAAWHFIAARRVGVAVPSTMKLKIRFALKDPTSGVP